MRPLMDFEKGYLVLFKRPFIIENSRQSRCGYSAINIGDRHIPQWLHKSVADILLGPSKSISFLCAYFRDPRQCSVSAIFFLWVGAKLVRGQDRCLVTHQRRKEKRGLT